MKKKLLKNPLTSVPRGMFPRLLPIKKSCRPEIVLAGGVYIPQELLDKENDVNLDLLKQEENSLNRTESNPNDIKMLSPRQTDVLQLIARGMSNKQIAYELGITEGTVKLYVTAILKVLGVYNRTAALIKAREWGILKDDGN